MQIKVSKIMSEFSQWELFESQHGPDNLITGLPDVRDCGYGDLVFIDSEEYIDLALDNKPSAVVTQQKFAEKFISSSDMSVLISTNVKLAQALMRQTYVDRDIQNNGWPQVHKSAVIHDSAKIAEDVGIGPGVVISKNVNIGSNSIILANTVIEEDVNIGSSVIIHPNVTVGYACSIGDRCIIKSGAVIGMEGFGFAQDTKQKSYRVPQLGNVIIGNDVVIGANCTIDRATFAHTEIMTGCKLDAQVHIAHNVVVDEDGLIVAQSGIAGSTIIGKRVRCSGQAAIIDHIKICDDVTLVHRPGVTRNIEEPGVYAGGPVLPMQKYFKNIAASRQLSEMKKTLDKLMKKIK